MRPQAQTVRNVQPRPAAMNEVHNFMEVNKELQKRYEEVKLEKAKFEAERRRDQKLYQIKINAAEENARQLEELLTDGDPAAAKKLEVSNQKIEILEHRLKTAEEASTVLNRQLQESQNKNSSQT